MKKSPLHLLKQTAHGFAGAIGYRKALRNPIFAAQIKALRAFHNRHTGERCFIIGNGPSLQRTDLNRLRNEFTFGLNRIYLIFDRLGFSTSYYVSTNPLVLSQFHDEIIARVPVPKFTVWERFPIARDIPEMHFIYRSNRARFSQDITRGIWGGATVTYVALQIAFYMGFSDVILIGVDHSFSTDGPPNKTIISTGDDPNHFTPDYFGKGIRWQLPDLETSEYAYTLARRAFEEAGRSIRDATVGGKLRVFPKIDYESLW